MNYDNLTDDGIIQTLNNGNVCILSVAKGNIPYCVPMYYTYELKDNIIYIKLKLSSSSKQLEYVKNNSNVCLLFDSKIYDTLNTVIIKGEAKLIEDDSSKMLVIKAKEVTGRSYE